MKHLKFEISVLVILSCCLYFCAANEKFQYYGTDDGESKNSMLDYDTQAQYRGNKVHKRTNDCDAEKYYYDLHSEQRTTYHWYHISSNSNGKDLQYEDGTNVWNVVSTDYDGTKIWLRNDEPLCSKYSSDEYIEMFRSYPYYNERCSIDPIVENIEFPDGTKMWDHFVTYGNGTKKWRRKC